MTTDAPGAPAPDTPHSIPPETVAHERRAIERLGRLRLVHWLTLLLSVGLTLVVWQYVKYQLALRTETRFNIAADQVAELIEERLQKYQVALWAGVAAIKTHDNGVDLDQWRSFAQNLDIEHRYPGINGIGVIHEITAADMPDYLARQRKDRPDFKVHPPRQADIYQPITFIEPEDINIEAVGLDMMHETNRYTALTQARDSASTQITGPIILVQDEGRTPGFLFFAPFYRTSDNGADATHADRFLGAVYAPFVVKRLMEGVLDKDRRATAVRISDGDEIIYDEISSEDTDYDHDAIKEKRILMSLYGREWALDIRSGLSFRQENSGIEAIVILVVGIVLDVALLAIFILLSRANRRGLRFADMATGALEAANRNLEIARKEAESASAMKSTFLSTMSHEVRTPLTAISGILELLERADLPAKQRMLVDTGRKASDRLIKLLTDVLDVSRLEANAVALWERDVPVSPLLNEWQRLAEGLVEKMKKAVSVTATVDDDVPETITVDDIRLSQVMNNLLDNAARFTKEGVIAIRAFRPDPTADGVERIGFSITDSGKGIAGGNMEEIFERFRQVDNSMTRDTSGAGLGLSICHELINLMGGTITVDSVVGTGTAFEVYLPVRGAASKGEKGA
ncbi:CHASE domain-containing protein [uncultured Roseobacter sp.]|uniref:CHASE domain-containing protein n=1 Tax=uncultured Roseobacter sp. TaxID=114847 RepID=UPI0026155B36|nr:CHASE domain-containing protein [uncultured Roseobacter sp.]